MEAGGGLGLRMPASPNATYRGPNGHAWRASAIVFPACRVVHGRRSVAAVMNADGAMSSCASPDGDSARTVDASDNGDALRMEALEGFSRYRAIERGCAGPTASPARSHTDRTGACSSP